MTTARGHVALLATGGTISSGPDGTLGAQSLIRLAASGTVGLPADVPVRGHDIASFNSSRVTVESIESLAASIRDAIARPGCLGVVVTHGTDTMEEVAFACDLLLGDTPKPVVFTGAIIPPRKQGTDAHGNLARAVRVAGAAPARFRGVVIVMQRGIHAASEARKLSTESADAFASPAQGPIGWIGGETIEHIREPARLTLATDRLEPRVELVRLTAGGGDRLLRAASTDARGLVVELFGAGNAPESVAEAMRDASNAGTLVLVCSRVGLGRLTPESSVHGAGAVPAVVDPDGPTPTVLDGLKARILLMAALGAGLDRDGLRQVLGSAATPGG